MRNEGTVLPLEVGVLGVVSFLLNLQPITDTKQILDILRTGRRCGVVTK
jgi:hypothetical protein